MQQCKIRQTNKKTIIYLLLDASTAFTAQTGSRVSPTNASVINNNPLLSMLLISFIYFLPTRKVMSHNSGMLAKNFMSSAKPVRFS